MKPTLFIVTDIETTLKHRIAFDVAWKIIDRKGNIYGQGSYLILESFFHDVPFFYQKLGFYFNDTWNHLIKPLPMIEIRAEYNKQLENLINKGYTVIFCAYNASFDSRYLGETSRLILNEPFLKVRLLLLDIWHYWALSAPRNYSALKTESGKFLSTTAQSVFQYEFNNPEFIEKHIACHDVEIESKILRRVLQRKQKMPLVDHPNKLASHVWEIANQRFNKIRKN